MLSHVRDRELVCIALQDDSVLKNLKKRDNSRKDGRRKNSGISGGRERSNYRHRDDKFPVETLYPKTFVPCQKVERGYLLDRDMDTITLLRIKGRNVRSCTLSTDSGNEIMKFHLVPNKKQKTFIVELPESIPLGMVYYTKILVSFDADEVTSIEQKGDYTDMNTRIKRSIQRFRFRHECSRTKSCLRWRCVSGH
ncbi:hypothetical protein GMAR_ORF248 [Golden Marseillevirus]|uniref:hypothetical protein n=1 Tax=Golden Marseillevirus TaxID=1720526 RepID=UPI000877AD0A|nr:hypothetical protein GMAR_ORF248 [Golden Marseillevirus]ALX27622.1 hypothetical protein GMAR_ORF248 [Golden Marseillevirus]